MMMASPFQQLAEVQDVSLDGVKGKAVLVGQGEVLGVAIVAHAAMMRTWAVVVESLASLGKV